MKSHFYSRLIQIDSLMLELNKMDLSEEERLHLKSLIDSSLHHTILDAVLSELNEDDKKVFLKHVGHESHEEVWAMLNDKVDNIEEKIKKVADDLVAELHTDIKETKETA